MQSLYGLSSRSCSLSRSGGSSGLYCWRRPAPAGPGAPAAPAPSRPGRSPAGSRRRRGSGSSGTRSAGACRARWSACSRPWAAASWAGWASRWPSCRPRRRPGTPRPTSRSRARRAGTSRPASSACRSGTSAGRPRTSRWRHAAVPWPPARSPRSAARTCRSGPSTLLRIGALDDRARGPPVLLDGVAKCWTSRTSRPGARASIGRGRRAAPPSRAPAASGGERQSKLADSARRRSARALVASLVVLQHLLEVLVESPQLQVLLGWSAW